MDRIMGRGALRALAVAVLGFAAVLVAAAVPSQAASYTLNYTGSVRSVPGGGLFSVLGVVPGDFVSGTVTIDPFNPVADGTSSGNSFFLQPSVLSTFHVEHPGAIDFTHTDTGNGEVVTAGSPHPVSGMALRQFGAHSDIELIFRTSATGGPLTSLAGLPGTPSELIALFGGNSPFAVGTYSLYGYGVIIFDIDFTTAVTPIPAALPLFASALGGLGFAAWRRRRARAIEAAQG
jgi:hypothetical protein